MRQHGRVDANQAAIADAQRAVGAWVWDTHALGNGFPDQLVFFRNRFYLQEIKSRTGKLTPAEQEWHRQYPGAADIVRTPEQALQVIGAIVVEREGGKP